MWRKWSDSSLPTRYPTSRQVRDRPTVGTKVFIQSDSSLVLLDGHQTYRSAFLEQHFTFLFSMQRSAQYRFFGFQGLIVGERQECVIIVTFA